MILINPASDDNDHFENYKNMCNNDMSSADQVIIILDFINYENMCNNNWLSAKEMTITSKIMKICVILTEHSTKSV